MHTVLQRNDPSKRHDSNNRHSSRTKSSADDDGGRNTYSHDSQAVHNATRPRQVLTPLSAEVKTSAPVVSVKGCENRLMDMTATTLATASVPSLLKSSSSICRLRAIYYPILGDRNSVPTFALVMSIEPCLRFYNLHQQRWICSSISCQMLAEGSRR